MTEEVIPNIVISWEEFCKKYEPIPNHIDHNASFDGFMFETFGDELLHVLKTLKEEHNTVWTIICEDPLMWIANGYWLVNRLGYVITRFPYLSNESITADRIKFVYDKKGNLIDSVEG